MSKDLDYQKRSLWERCKRASGWALIGSGGSQAIRLLRMMLVVYFVMPEQMGLWVVLIAIIGMFNEFTDSGVKHALIQNRHGHEPIYLNCAWLICLTRSLLLIALLYILAPWIGRYYQSKFDADELISVLRLGCFLFLFDGLSSISLVALRKQLYFRPLVIIQLISNLVGLMAVLFFAWKWKNAEAILVGEILCSLSLCIMSYLVHPFRPGLYWDKKVALELLSYGGMTYLVAMVDAIALPLDILVVSEIHLLDSASGAFSEQALVGLYGVGRTLIFAATLLLTQLSLSIGFPALSELQQDRAAMRRGVLEIVKATQFVAIPLFGMLYLLGLDLVQLLPIEYANTGLVLRHLSVTGFLLVFLRQLTPALYAINKMHWCLWRGLAYILLFALLAYPLSQRWGLVGVCWAVNLAYLISTLMILLVTLRQLQWPVLQWCGDMSLSVRSTIGAGLAILLFLGLCKLIGFSWSGTVWVRISSCGVGVLSYGVLNLRGYILPMIKRLA